MFDCHVHSVFSDGSLIPSEIAQRYMKKGYKGIIISDHGDFTNYQYILENLINASEKLSFNRLKVLPGIELTHVQPELIRELVEKCRKEYPQVVILCHGETIAEPVEKGTNRAAIEAKVDILAHPGLISDEDVLLAKENSVCLEISGRKGHSLTNGHVVKLALKYDASLCFGSDSHSPEDIYEIDYIYSIIKGAGVHNIDRVLNNNKNFFERRHKL